MFKHLYLIRSTVCAVTWLTALAAVGHAYAGQTETPKRARVTIQDGGVLGKGMQLYAKHCALCHGEDGEGYQADNANALHNQDFLVSVDDEFLRHSIANGRPGTPMAAYHERYDGPFTESDVWAVVAFIRSWQQEGTVDVSRDLVFGDAEAGRSTYSEHCAECHGEEGEGVNAVSLNNPEFLSTASDGQIRWAIAKGRRDTPMMAYEQKFSSSDIDDLVAVIRSWQRDAPARAEGLLRPELQGVVINPSGNIPEFSLRDGRYVSGEQVHKALQGGYRLVILDARPASDWHLGHIPGAVSAPHYEPDAVIDKLPKDGTWIVSYCACPHTLSGRLTNALRKAGFQNAVILDEGVRWWRDSGYPMSE